MQKKKKFFLSIVMTSLFVGTLFSATPVFAQQNRVFKDYVTGKLYTPASYMNDPAVFDELLNQLSDEDTAGNFGVSFGGNFYSYAALLNNITHRPKGETPGKAFTDALKDKALVIESSTTASAVELAVIPPVKDYNQILGYTTVKVNNTALIKSVTVDGKETTAYNVVNSTTVRIMSDTEPYNITLTSTSGKTFVVIDKPRVTLAVTKVGDFNPIMGFIDIKVNDTSLVDKVVVNGTELSDSNIRKLSGESLRLLLDEEPTQIILKTKDGKDVTAYSKK